MTFNLNAKFKSKIFSSTQFSANPSKRSHAPKMAAILVSYCKMSLCLLPMAWQFYCCFVDWCVLTTSLLSSLKTNNCRVEVVILNYCSWFALLHCCSCCMMCFFTVSNSLIFMTCRSCWLQLSRTCICTCFCFCSPCLFLQCFQTYVEA